MTDKPRAAEIKKDILALWGQAPEGADPARLLLALANDSQGLAPLARRLGIEPADLQQALACHSRLATRLRDWAEPASPEKKEKPAPPPAPLLDDPAAIAGHDQVKVFTDGASKGNPGPASVGIVVTDLEGRPLYEEGRYLGVMTNNAAEYEGLIAALEILVANGAPRAYCFSDSALVVNQVKGAWKVKHAPLMPLLSRAQSLRRQLAGFQIAHVGRAKNARADELANLAIRQHRDASRM